MMRIAGIFLTILGALACWSCGDVDEPSVAAGTRRTVLVYMSAANSLGTGEFDRSDLAEMREGVEASLPQDCRWIVYHHAYDAAPVLVELTRHGADTIIAYSPEIYSTDGLRLRSVARDVMRVAPADGYGLVMWSHSTGWESPYRPAPSWEKGPRSWGDDRGTQMDIPALADALTELRPEFIYFDCCYMASVEVAYELRDVTAHIVASPTEVPADGMPYELNVEALCDIDADLEGAAMNTYRYYARQASPSARSCAMTVIDTAPLTRLATVTRAIYGRHGTEAVGYTRQRLDRDREQRFWDFADHVRALCTGDEELSGEFEEAFAATVRLHRHTPRMWNIWSLDRSTGLSGYIYPTVGGDPTYRGYDGLQWWRDVVAGAAAGTANADCHSKTKTGQQTLTENRH